MLLGKRKNSHGESSWGPAGGHLEYGETLEECAIREVKEETGVSIKLPEFLAFTNDFFELEQKHYLSVFMVTKIPENQKINNLEPNKTEIWNWFDLSNLPNPLFLPLENLILNKSYGTKYSEYCETLKQYWQYS